ncbi:MAG: hypothetical protein ACETVW_04085 [Dehalococcoidia bacterium]
MMLWKKKSVTEKPPQPKVEKLPGPKPIPGLVGKHLIAEYKMDPDLVGILKAVVRKSPKAEKAFDCRIFDESEAEASEVQIKDYTSLDGHPELILYEGWFDDESKHVELEEKKKLIYDVPLFTETEILQKIEALTELGSTVFFYQARGPAVGGPLGRGAAIVELNPDYLTKKGRKYIIYTANVVGMEPVGERQKLFDSNKPKDIAKWVKNAHHKRAY